MAKNTHHVCGCGAKFRTYTALMSHVNKRKIREDAGWEKKGLHSYAYMEHEGTKYESEDLAQSYS